MLKHLAVFKTYIQFVNLLFSFVGIYDCLQGQIQLRSLSTFKGCCFFIGACVDDS